MAGSKAAEAEAELGSKLSVWILSYMIQQTNETTHTGSGNIPEKTREVSKGTQNNTEEPVGTFLQ